VSILLLFVALLSVLFECSLPVVEGVVVPLGVGEGSGLVEGAEKRLANGNSDGRDALTYVCCCARRSSNCLF
jgi:hypothetical protein